MEPQKHVFIKRDETLKRDQIRTLNVIRGNSRIDSDAVAPQLRDKLIIAAAAQKIEFGDDILALVTDYVATSAPLVIHMSPATISIVSKDGFYRSSFETNSHANTPLNASHYMAARVKWESLAFKKLYDTTTNFERPKYGALNYLNLRSGAAPAYGNCYLTLADSARHRVTITAGDTSQHNRNIGVLQYCNHILTELSAKEMQGLVAAACGLEHTVTVAPYREIQIHGELRLDRDFKSIHSNTAGAIACGELAKKYGLDLIII